MKHSLSDQRIIKCLHTDYGIDVTSLTSLPLGADMNASVYRAETQDHALYFIKLKRGHHHDISVTVLELLDDIGIKQIIPPLKTIRGQSTQPIDDFTLIIYPFVAGQNGFCRDLTIDQWVMLGKVLRQIHDIVVPPDIQDQIRHETYSPKWREAVRALYTGGELEQTNDEIAVKLREFMKRKSVTIHRLVDRAEQLAQTIENESHPFVLCHSDIHGGNVLIGDKDSFYIVDWDEPIMAPKERDLMFIGAGIADVWNQPHEEKAFYKGYGKTDVSKTLLAYYRHERIVEDLAIYGQQVLLTTAAPQDRLEDRMEAYDLFISQFEPGSVVDIAFTTDEDQGSG